MVVKRVPLPGNNILSWCLTDIVYVFQGFEVDFFVHEQEEAPRFVGTAHLLPPTEDCSIHIKRAPIIGLNHRPIGEVKGLDNFSDPFLFDLLLWIVLLHYL